MARCRNKACRKKVPDSMVFNSFDVYCSDKCKSIVKMQQKPLTNSKPLQAKKGLNQYTTLKSKTPLKSNKKLSGAALGSIQYKQEKKERDEKRKLKAPKLQPRKVDGLTLKSAEAKAKTVCHKYIRLRDYGKPCPCCGQQLGDDYQAGHFLKSGSNSEIRYDENNIHGQRADCNLMKGGDSGEYEKNLRDRIGDDIVDSLIQKSKENRVIKRTIEDYLEIISYYEVKIHLLEKTNAAVA